MDLTCPQCLQNETIRVNLDDGDTLTCTGCDAEYTVTAVKTLLDEWAKIMPWLLSHPLRKGK